MLKYFSILRINWIHSLEYRANALIGLFAILSGLFIEYQIWSLIFSANSHSEIAMDGVESGYSFKQLMNILLKSINRKRILLYTPKKIAILMAKFFQILPNPLITEDQIKLLNYDNIVLNNHLTFKELKINPTSLELIIPNYLKRFKKY